MEDAALLRPESGSPLAFTVDFITPIVDDPYDYGAIAAANSLSDVYAVGGQPCVGLAICGFPEEVVPHEVLVRIFQGGRDKAAEADCAIAGGHTVLDPELKCVLGSVAGAQPLKQSGGRPGDVLVLTKPIGSGIAAQAIKSGRLAPEDLAPVVDAMKRLNADARDAALTVGAHAATDVTGFGLLGHLYHLATASGTAARLRSECVPVFGFARALAEEGVVPGGTRRNADYVASQVDYAAGLGEVERLLLCDAQTSGGLLLAVAPEQEQRLRDVLDASGALASATVGELVEPGGLGVGRIAVE